LLHAERSLPPSALRRVSMVLLATVPVVVAAPAHAGEPEVTWRWQRFQPAEYVATAAMLAGAFGLRFGAPPKTEPVFTDGILVDDWFYETAYPRDADARKAWELAGDVPYWTSYLWGAADPLIAGFTHGWDVGSQMLLINLESYSAYSMVLFGAQYVIPRRRPAESGCDGHDGPADHGDCDSPESVRAFIGGHTGFVSTTAALTCLHHAYMPLFGDGFANHFPCAYWVTASALVFTARAVKGDHYLSDDILGLGVGMLAGGLLPWALHYAHGPLPWGRSDDADATAARLTGVMLGPTERRDGATLSATGLW
jgi:hypothetical protein